MDVPQELIDLVRREGRRRRRLSRTERQRIELAPYVDTGAMSDDDVGVLYGHFTAARDEPREER